MEEEKINFDYKKINVFKDLTIPFLQCCPEIIYKNLPGDEAAKEIIKLNDALVAYFVKN